MTNIGDNSTLNSSAREKLRSFVERVENLEVSKAELGADIKDVFGEAKADGFDVAIMRKVIRLRKMDRVKRDEEAALVELYMHALGEV